MQKKKKKEEERPPSSLQLEVEVNINTGQIQSLADGATAQREVGFKNMQMAVEYMHINTLHAALAGKRKGGWISLDFSVYGHFYCCVKIVLRHIMNLACDNEEDLFG